MTPPDPALGPSSSHKRNLSHTAEIPCAKKQEAEFVEIRVEEKQVKGPGSEKGSWIP